MQTPEALKAADSYIAEREAKRAKNYDISKHQQYTVADRGVQTSYGGIRRINGQALLLVVSKGLVQVLPVDEKTAVRLSRLKVGDGLVVNESGIKREGRGR